MNVGATGKWVFNKYLGKNILILGGFIKQLGDLMAKLDAAGFANGASLLTERPCYRCNVKNTELISHAMGYVQTELRDPVQTANIAAMLPHQVDQNKCSQFTRFVQQEHGLKSNSPLFTYPLAYIPK